MATLDDENENTDAPTQPDQTPPAVTGTPYFTPPTSQADNTQNIKDLLAKNQLLKSAQQDIATSQEKAIKPEDLNALAQRQNTDQLTKLFMNFAGATNRVNAAPYTSIVGQGTEQEQQRLGLQQNLANQALNRGLAEQKAGLQQYQLEKQNQPISPQMLDQINVNRQKVGLPSLDKNTEYPTYMLPQLLSQSNEGIKTALSLRGQDITQQKNVANEAIGQQKNVIAGQNATTKSKKLVSTVDENGNVTQGVADVNTGEAKSIPGTVVPSAVKVDQHSFDTFNKNLKTSQVDSVQAHTAIQNYDHAFDGLNPAEQAKADSLARRQIGAIASKFDQGVKSNAITSANQLLGTIAKMEQTQEFNTPENPEIGKAAFQRAKSALAFATMTQAGKTRPSNFATQFSLGNSFGSNIPFTGVPSEKVEELRKLTEQNLGGALQTAIAASPNKKIANQIAHDMFGDSYSKYVDSYTGLGKPKQNTVNTNQNAPDQTIKGVPLSSAADLLK